MKKLGLAALTLLALSCRHAADTESSSGPPKDARPKNPATPSTTPTATHWWNTAVFYEIFVRSFQDTNGDGIGDFNGLTQRLDTLNDGDPTTTSDLGVNALWLMPIYPSPSYHGYDVTDYRAVHPDYGTLSDFEALLQAAHRRGIRVIVDFVINHASSEHPWFTKARADPKASTRDWFVFRPAPDPKFRRPWDGSLDIWHPTDTGYYYGLFWSGMPDLYLQNPEVEKEMIASMKFWLEKGVDGFRLDAVRYLIEEPNGQNADTPATHALLKRVRRELETDYPEAVLIAEAWTGREAVAPYYGNDDEMHLAFGFDTASAVLSSAKDGLRAPLMQSLRELRGAYPSPSFEAPFLTNHDMKRVMQELASQNAEGAARPAAATLFALPGTPFIYYGEELGMVGGPSTADEDKRTPMRWTAEAPGYGFTQASAPWRVSREADGIDVASQQADPQSLWHLYRRLIGLRSSTAPLQQGALELLTLQGGGRGTAGFLRTTETETILFVANFHREVGAPLEIPRPIPIEQSPTVLLAEGLPSAPTRNAEGLIIPPLAPFGFAFIRL